MPVAQSQMMAVSRWLVMPMAIGMLPRDRASATMAEVNRPLFDILRIVLQPAVSRKMLQNSADCWPDRAFRIEQNGVNLLPGR